MFVIAANCRTHLTRVIFTGTAGEVAWLPTLSLAVAVTDTTPSPLSSVLLGVSVEPLVRVAVDGVMVNA